MSGKYDPAVIQDMANRLYNESKWLILRGAVVGALFGAMTGSIVALLLGELSSVIGGVAVVVFGTLCAALGASYSHSRTFLLRLQAQKLLCQVQIEINTRRLSNDQSA